MILLVPIAGCATTSDSSSDWKSLPPTAGWPWDIAEPVRHAEVKPSAIAQAEQAIQDTSFIRLNADALHAYIDNSSQFVESDEVYLVRGLATPHGTGGFQVSFDGRNLYVNHTALAHKRLPAYHQPLVVALPTPPERVYVWNTTAE